MHGDLVLRKQAAASKRKRHKPDAPANWNQGAGYGTVAPASHRAMPTRLAQWHRGHDAQSHVLCSDYWGWGWTFGNRAYGAFFPRGSVGKPARTALGCLCQDM